MGASVTLPNSSNKMTWDGTAAAIGPANQTYPGTFLANYLTWNAAGGAWETPGQIANGALASQVDAFYLVINAQAVFLMQSGFMLLEVGSVRASHAKAICVKNCCDFLVCTICWLVLGYPLAFGSGEFFGDGWWFGSTEEGFGDFTREAAGTLDANWATWFFQWSFASATCTIVSGAGAERCSFQGYLMSTCLLAAFVYPVVVHSMWSDDAWAKNGHAPFYIKAHDYAGSGVVHLVGGTGALVLAYTIGARDGRFGKNGEVNSHAPHNLVLGALGGLLLLTGWFGFNGGSSLGASGGYAMEGARVCAITSIAAPCCVVFPVPAGIIGCVGGFIYMWASQLMLDYQIDDPLDAAPIHGVCGIWGLLAVGLFANGTYGIVGVFYISEDSEGVDYSADTAFRQLYYQIMVAIWEIVWSASILGAAYHISMAYGKSTMRVPIDIELAGDLVLYGGSAYPQFGKEGGNAPESGELAIVITDVQDSTALWSWNEEVMVRSIDMQFALLRDNCVRFHGFEIMDEGDSITVVFHDAFDATRFCIITQGDLMTVSWPDALYNHPSASRDGLYSGLRVRMIMEFGFGNKFLNQVTNRLSYEGDLVESANAIAKAIDDGGIVVASNRVLRELQEKWSHRLYELGPHKIQDIGTFRFETGPTPLVQIMPEELAARPPSVVSGVEQIGLGYAQAPGVGEGGKFEEGKDVCIIFCTFQGQDFNDGDMDSKKADSKAAEEANNEKWPIHSAMKSVVKEDELTTGHIMLYFAHQQEGYVTKTSNGVSLLAFPTAENGLRFVESVSDCLKQPGCAALDFCAGLHQGIPKDVSANLASGRADYLGPPVNTSARLLSLATTQRAKFGDGNMSVAVSEMAATTLDSEDRSTLEGCGEFLLKGIDSAVPCYAVRRGDGGARWKEPTGVGAPEARRASRASMTSS